ncbi:MAG: exodeoxyribonuclease VII large subunit [Pseudomonadota bacterium]
MHHNIPEFTVSEFSRSIKRMVEDNFGYVRIKGEVSGFKRATSGHLYFNLKDETAVINAVCFKQMASLIAFDVADGLEVVASGKITIYEGRSNYQIIVEKLEIAGIGAILAAIEKRRLRLLEEGYFDDKHKKSLPFLPKIIGVITSPTGAVIEDIINRITARFPTNLLVYPVAVQGKNAALEVIAGVKYFNATKEKPDVIIIARGGGSVEDLLPFNDEDLVKAVFNSTIPIISAVGHETDTTLIDYAADMRAPTPSAAAEMAVPVLKDLQNLSDNLGKRLANYFGNLFENKKNNLSNLANNLIHPRQKLADLEQNFLQLFLQLKNNFNHHLRSKEQDLKLFSSHIQKPSNQYDNWQNRINFLNKNLQNNGQNFLKNYQNKISLCSNLLISYDYKNVLARGYSVIRVGKNIIDSKNKVKNNLAINVEVADGNFQAMVIDRPQKSLPSKKEDDRNEPLLFELK